MLRTDVAAIAALVELAVIGVLVIAIFFSRAKRRTRLAAIEQLLVRAAEGDFAEEFDEERAAPADSIARVGRAYNRVRAQLARMVLTDPLSGCVNRRGFDRALVREVARGNRAGSEIALLALDIDNFKVVNDTLGHPTGDAVLRGVGAFLRQAARAGDVVARTGGEEFSLILPDTSATAARQVASRLCEAVRAHRFASGASLTVSIGVVSTGTTISGHTLEIAEVLKGRADEALYAAKRAGRDRVRAWAPREEQIALGALT